MLSMCICLVYAASVLEGLKSAKLCALTSDDEY